ncbi:hypothetical protein IAQ61_000147 [Plenodomus lingam]|uniref:uncharacterized protein n=1 Tax=Leptosphaeria maculans TaxID=5022 RepID=UPI0033329812|nr:hypothetical protein IAQ61_000147 [Plenodomus lingam]
MDMAEWLTTIDIHSLGDFSTSIPAFITELAHHHKQYVVLQLITHAVTRHSPKTVPNHHLRLPGTLSSSDVALLAHIASRDCPPKQPGQAPPLTSRGLKKSVACAASRPEE